jgi:hypothetical protein
MFTNVANPMGINFLVYCNNMDPKIIAIILLVVGVAVYIWYSQQEKEEEPAEPTAPATEETTTPTSPTEPMEPAAPTADAVIKIDGLVAWYDGPSYDETSRTWKDKSDKGHDITEITGILKKSKNGEEVQGDVDSVVAFPQEILEDEEEYTFINVTKYNGPAKGRIFTTKNGSDENILLGFHANKAGVYYGDRNVEWISQTIDRHGDKWTLSTVQPKLYRSNGALRTAFRNPESEDIGNVPKRIYINGWSTEKSDWSVKEMIVYNRLLTQSEYIAIEKALAEKYDIKPNRYELSALKGDASSEGWPEIVRDVQFRCGKGEALTEFAVNDSKQSVYSCMSGIDLDGDEVEGKTIYEDIKGGSEYFKNLQNNKIDCGESPINALTLAMDEDEEKIRYEYTCNNSKVKKNTCQTVVSDDYATGTSFDNMSGLTNTACPTDHVITSAKLVADGANQKWELTCCKPKGI